MIISGTNLLKKHIIFSFFLIFLACLAKAQTGSDTISREQGWNFHFQHTVIDQYHPPFNAKYSGTNSLSASEENDLSISTTLYFGLMLWKGARLYFNPELSGGSGFSQTRGVAAFPNGEVYRVSDATPQAYIARLYAEQIIPLADERVYIPDGMNQLAMRRPVSYIAISAGKFSMLDFFDNNKYSNDPRTQFYNWALMGNGAWDYPANTRGYTVGLTFELVKPEWSLKLAAVMVPARANGSEMDFNLRQAHATALEFDHKYSLGKQPGKIRLMAYLNKARMGNYKSAIVWGKENNTVPEVDSVGRAGNSKYGFGINAEQAISGNVGFFLRAGWNDGTSQTWIFTEIDRHFSSGVKLNGALWNRRSDILGIAQIVDGLSKDHRDYLKAGGYGFIIGDGNLNYEPELVTEVYYSFKLSAYPFWISPDYQFIINPAYNKDRGPVHAFGIRAHCEF